MSVYIIAQIEIFDRVEYRRYEAGFLELFAKFKGEALVAEEHPEVLEGEWRCTRTAVIRFDNAWEAKRFYDSPENQELEKIRKRSSKNNMIVARGVRETG